MIANGQVDASQVDKVQALADLVKKKLADLPFLLGILGFVEPNHLFFGKNYVYEKPRRPLVAAEMPVINNDDGFFDNLPVYSEKARGRKKLRMTKLEKKRWQIIQMQAKQQQLEQRLGTAQRELAAMDADSEEDQSAADIRTDQLRPQPSQSPLIAQPRQLQPDNVEEVKHVNPMELHSNPSANEQPRAYVEPGNDEMADETGLQQQEEEEVLRPQSVSRRSTSKRRKQNVPLNPSAIASSVKRNHAARNNNSDINQIAGFMQGM